MVVNIGLCFGLCYTKMERKLSLILGDEDVLFEHINVTVLFFLCSKIDGWVRTDFTVSYDNCVKDMFIVLLTIYTSKLLSSSRVKITSTQ